MAAPLADYDYTPAYPEPDDDLLKLFLNLDTPPGFRAELIDQEIIVTPPPIKSHERLIYLINDAIGQKRPPHLGYSMNFGLTTPRGHYIPDLTICSLESLDREEVWSAPGEVELVVEITSRDPQRDREQKRLGYAEAGIPLYLLIDRSREKTILFSHPEAGDYRLSTIAAFGESMDLPDPFGFTLETTDFR